MRRYLKQLDCYADDRIPWASEMVSKPFFFVDDEANPPIKGWAVYHWYSWTIFYKLAIAEEFVDLSVNWYNKDINERRKALKSAENTYNYKFKDLLKWEE